MLLWPFIDWKKTVRAPASRPVGMILAVLFLVVVFSLLGVSLKNLYAVKLILASRMVRHWLPISVAPAVTGFMAQAVTSDRTYPMWEIDAETENGTSNISAIRSLCHPAPLCRSSLSPIRNSAI